MDEIIVVIHCIEVEGCGETEEIATRKAVFKWSDELNDLYHQCANWRIISTNRNVIYHDDLPHYEVKSKAYMELTF